MWSSSKKCFYWHGDQKTPDWDLIRKYGVGGSNCHGVAFGNYYGSKFSPPEEYHQIILGQKKVEMNEDMARGVAEEPKIYDLHSQILLALNEEKGISEKPLFATIGIAISKKFPVYRCSNDSLVFDASEKDPYGSGEYKSARRLYNPLRPSPDSDILEIEDMIVVLGPGEKEVSTSKSPLAQYNPTNIYCTHYAQIQFQLAVTGRKWCDYVVASFDENLAYFERVTFNPKYWEKLDKAIQKSIKGILPQIDKEIFLPDLDSDIWFETDEVWKKIVPK